MTKNRILKKNLLKLLIGITAVILCIGCMTLMQTYAAPSIDISVDSGEADASSSALDLLFLLAMLALIPSLLLVMTAFTRIIISLSFLRNAIGTQTTPPNQVLIGLALFLTIFIMFPTFTEMKNSAYDPYKSGKISQTEAIHAASEPLKEFMLRQVYETDLDLFITLAQDKGVAEVEKVSSSEELVKLPMIIVIPAFITSEIKRAFMIGFLIYIPFLIIDIIVSSTLMSMGMMMLPPATISLPFKLMLFVLVDGWNLLIQGLITGFR